MVDKRLAEKGSKEHLDALVQQGSYHNELVAKNEAALIKRGFKEQQKKDLGELVQNLGSDDAKRAVARAGSRGATRTEQSCLQACKDFFAEVRVALPLAIKDKNDPNIVIDNFHVGEKLGRSTPRIIQYTGRLEGQLVPVDEALKPYLEGRTASVEAKRLREALQNADSSQEVSIASLPEHTQKVYENMGRLLELIEDINRIGKLAFAGQAAIAGQFNKDILLRARKQHSGKAGKEEQPAK